MMYRQRLLASSLLLLTACGGGGESESSSGEPTLLEDPIFNSGSYTVTGTVPGTLIEGFCDDGSYYYTHSINNGTSYHPFSLELPSDQACRLVMTTNEESAINRVVVPIAFQLDGGSGIAFSASDRIDLGYIPLPLSRAAMVADSNGDGVEDSPYTIDSNTLDSQIGGALRARMALAPALTDPLDSNRNGIVDIYDDDDGDHQPNRYDDDRDGDSVVDRTVLSDDLDGDGISNDRDRDDDNDGIPDLYDHDRDNDGVSNDLDDDDDNDGVVDSLDSDTVSSSSVLNDGRAAAAATAAVPDGRLLAAQCAQCHGTDGISVSGIESLAGEAGEIREEMAEMVQRAGSDIMSLQAHGYSSEQIQFIASWYGAIGGSALSGTYNPLDSDSGESDHDDDDD